MAVTFGVEKIGGMFEKVPTRLAVSWDETVVVERRGIVEAIMAYKYWLTRGLGFRRLGNETPSQITDRSSRYWAIG